VLVICCAALIAIGAIAAAGRSSGSGPDDAVDSWILAHVSSHSAVPWRVADIGGGIVTAAVTAALVIACLAARRVNGALLALVSVLLATVLTERVLKPLVGETIGSPPALSYPSGHTTEVVTLAAVVAVLLLNPPRGRPGRGARVAVVVAAALIACAVAVSLIAIRWHYFTDTVAGAAVGIAVVLLTALTLDIHRVRSRLPMIP